MLSQQINLHAEPFQIDTKFASVEKAKIWLNVLV